MAVEAGSVAPPEAEERPSGLGLIPFQLRIGVTSHRKLPEGQDLRKAVDDAIGLAIEQSGYPKVGLRNTPLRLVVVSALADGADRLVAEEVLLRSPQGNKLVCVLPVTEKDIDLYRADFESDDSRHDFDRLREKAGQQIEPPSDLVPSAPTQEQRNAGYLWAGKEVVRNSDVVIAIWDGQSSGDVGGTADLIHWMRERDDIEGAASDPAEGIRPRPRRGAIAYALFGSSVPEEHALGVTGPVRIIVSTNTKRAPRVDSGPDWEAAIAAKRERLESDLKNLDKFNQTRFDNATDWQRSVDQVMNDLAPADYRESLRLCGLLKQIAPPLNRADQAAMAAQHWFLWSSYAFFGSTALATIVAALQVVVFPGLWELAFGELALLIASIAIVGAERRWKNNNKHWFAYRFLAERLRTAYYLLAVGCIPPTDFDVGGTAEEPAQNDWVQRAFAAVMAGCDARRQVISEDPETLNSLIRNHWMGGQMNYFDRTSKKLMRKHNRVLSLLYTLLCATIVAAVLHGLRIWPFHSGDTEALVMCAIGLPAAAGALSNVRSIREFSRHSFRYARMAAVLRRYTKRFNDELDIDTLRQVATEVGDLLTEETRGWLLEVSQRDLEIHG
jgi:hypothetical protein